MSSSSDSTDSTDSDSCSASDSCNSESCSLSDPCDDSDSSRGHSDSSSDSDDYFTTDDVTAKRWRKQRRADDCLDVFFMCIVTVVCVSIVCTCIRDLLFPRGEQTTPLDAYQRLLTTVMDAHASVIADEDRRQLSAAAARWFDDASEDPVVVLIYAPDDSLLRDLLTATADFIEASPAFVLESAGQERDELHAAFERTLTGRRSALRKSAIGLRHLERLPWNAPLVLYSFADAEKTLPARPLIFLQVTSDDSLRGMQCADAIERTLTDAWISSGGNIDSIPPIVARVIQFTLCLDWDSNVIEN